MCADPGVDVTRVVQQVVTSTHVMNGSVKGAPPKCECFLFWFFSLIYTLHQKKLAFSSSIFAGDPMSGSAINSIH